MDTSQERITPSASANGSVVTLDDAHLAAVQQQIDTTRQQIQELEAEVKQKESQFEQLQVKREALRCQTENVRQRTREVKAETAIVENHVRAVEELEMLDSMLVEKNTQLLTLQVRQDVILQQLACLEAVVEGSNGSRHDPSSPLSHLAQHRVWDVAQTSDGHRSSCNSEAPNTARTLMHEAAREGRRFDNGEEKENHAWNALRRAASGLERYCLFCTRHLATMKHPVSVFHNSVRKMCRTAHAREEELLTHLEDVDTLKADSTALDTTLREMEANYQTKRQQLEKENTRFLRQLAEAASSEVQSLRAELQSALADQKGLNARIREKGGAAEVLEESIRAAHTPGSETRTGMDSGMGFHTNLGQWVGCTPSPNKRLHFSTSESTPQGNGHPIADGTPLHSAAILRPLNTTTASWNSPNTTGVSIVTLCAGSESPVIAPCDVVDAETVELRRRLAAAAEEVQQLEVTYEAEEDAARVMLDRHETEIRCMEERLRAARDVVAVLKTELAEWQVVKEQMAVMIQPPPSESSTYSSKCGSSQTTGVL